MTDQTNSDGDKLVRGKALFKQSSELEILISAAIIFTALQISDVISLGITILLNFNVASNSPFLIVLAVVGLYLSTLLPISIVAHFVLRIFWLSLVGLHSAFPNKDEVKEGYDDKYRSIINKSLDLDKQINKLDQLGSSIFAFSFLTLFSFCFPFASIFTLTYLFSSIQTIPGINETFAGIVSLVLLVLFGIAVLAYTVDYLTGGWLKRVENKVFKKVYYWIYRFMSVITLASLSRGIYYKLSVNLPRRTVVIITTVYLCIGFFFSNAGYYSNELYPIVSSETLVGKNVLFDAKYADRFEENTVMRAPFIKSFVLERGSNHLEVSIPLSRDLEDSLISNCPNIKPYHERGVHWRAYFTIGNVNTFDYDSTFSVDGNAKAILDCFKNNITVTIDDSLHFDVDFKFTRHDVPDKTKLVGYVPTDGLTPGHHNLGLNAADIFLKETYYIPFLKD